MSFFYDRMLKGQSVTKQGENWQIRKLAKGNNDIYPNLLFANLHLVNLPFQ